MDTNWDKTVTIQLKDLLLNDDQVSRVIDILSEHRQNCYIAGYGNGFNAGFEKGKRAGLEVNF